VITGKLGDVMQESAKAALSYIRSRSANFGLKPDFHKEIDIHIHVPDGATPKDGPSAGITLATAMVSALLNLPVRNDLSMTGEITLRGRVLPIGGLREKLLAAHRGRIAKVLVPDENDKDLKEVPEAILTDLEVVLVKDMDEVLEQAILCENPDKLFCGKDSGVPPLALSLLKDEYQDQPRH
jgi:ATP-dependent Lon protease